MQYLEIVEMDEGQILIIRFMRPESLNAMNRAMMDELVSVAEQLAQRPLARVVILTGAGSSFMAGADIKEYASSDNAQFFAFQRQGVRIYRALEESNLPVIAAVDGYALGGGFEIALACDFIIAAESAQLGLPEVHLGLVPGGGGTQRLVQRVGLSRAKEILLTGDRYSAQKFFEWGIVSALTPTAPALDAALEFARKLCRRSPSALAQLKQLLRLSLPGSDISSRLFFEGQTCYHLFTGAEAQEKIAAFAQKTSKK